MCFYRIVIEPKIFHFELSNSEEVSHMTFEMVCHGVQGIWTMCSQSATWADFTQIEPETGGNYLDKKKIVVSLY